jgi:uncharacterized membrane protein
VAVDIARLKVECPLFFTLPYHGKKVNFFVMRTANGVVSFLDACASCYPYKLGYRVDRGQLACRRCNVRYSLSNIEKGFGNCFPIQIEGHLKDGEYRIPVSRLQAAADNF